MCVSVFVLECMHASFWVPVYLCEHVNVHYLPRVAVSVGFTHGCQSEFDDMCELVVGMGAGGSFLASVCAYNSPKSRW